MRIYLSLLSILLLSACGIQRVDIKQPESAPEVNVENQEPIIANSIDSTTNKTIGDGNSFYSSKWGFSFEYPSQWNVYDDDLESNWVKNQHLHYLKLIPYKALDDLPSEEEWISEILMTFFDFQFPIKSKNPPYESANLYENGAVNIYQLAEIYQCENIDKETIGDKSFFVGEHTFYNPDEQKEFTQKCYFYFSDSKGVLINAFIEQSNTEDFLHTLDTFKFLENQT